MTDAARFSGGLVGLVTGYVAPRRSSALADRLVEDGDLIVVDPAPTTASTAPGTRRSRRGRGQERWARRAAAEANGASIPDVASVTDRVLVRGCGRRRCLALRGGGMATPSPN